MKYLISVTLIAAAALGLAAHSHNRFDELAAQFTTEADECRLLAQEVSTPDGVLFLEAQAEAFDDASTQARIAGQ